jgi:cation diffusion facilitator CzcD-associated flavoprotein CzcO
MVLSNGASSSQTNGQSGPEYDCLIVGAGFGGIYLLVHLRKLGYRCRIYDAGTDLGGTWHCNRYPGARVDSEVPVYEYSMQEAWKDWTWTERFPGWKELRQYFKHIDNVYNVKKDVEFKKKVVGGEFDTAEQKWKVKTEDGQTTTCRFFLVCTGFAAKRYIPDFPGLETFKGEIHHSSHWPEEDVDVRGKRCAIIGTGSTGVQITQEWAKEAKTLTVFQRTPNLALPMEQRKLTAEEQNARKSTYPQFFVDRQKTFAGFQYDFLPKKALEATPEEREALYERLWQRGGFEYWLATFEDTLFDLKANRFAYDFWAKKTRARINDPRKRDILAPLEPPHPFGTKRPSLEQDYYEMFNKTNVDVVDVKKNKIVEVKPDGILTSDGSFYPVDVLALATGFDSVTGSMANMGLRSTRGQLLADEWKDGANTYLGLVRNGYPNMFFLYGAHGPTAFANGPSSTELQGELVVDAIQKIDKSGILTVEPTVQAEKAWKEKVNHLSDITLFPLANSWYMGANIPGKKREQLNFTGGLPLYEKECREALESWNGFITV